jgi:hypothetical protein
MLVHSFDESKTSWIDYESFAKCLGPVASRGATVGPKRVAGVDLHLGDSPKASNEVAASAV